MAHHSRLAAGCRQSRTEQTKYLLIGSAIVILLAGCSLPAERNVRAYDNCLSRHPQESALCEGPLEAYEVDTSIFEAKAAPISPPAIGGYDDRRIAGPSAPTPLPVRLDQAPRTADPHG
jgi:hypothetical protein